MNPSNYPRRTALVVHGLTADGNRHWSPWLREQGKQFNIEVLTPDLPNTNDPTLDEWIAYLERFNDRLDATSIVIGHSIGAPTAMAFVTHYRKAIGHLVLVAPANPLVPRAHLEVAAPTFNWKNAYQFFTTPIDWELLQSLVPRITIFYSNNDFFIPQESIEYFKEHLPAAEFRFIPGRFHFSDRSDIHDFPELLEAISQPLTD